MHPKNRVHNTIYQHHVRIPLPYHLPHSIDDICCATHLGLPTVIIAKSPSENHDFGIRNTEFTELEKIMLSHD